MGGVAEKATLTVVDNCNLSAGVVKKQTKADHEWIQTGRE